MTPSGTYEIERICYAMAYYTLPQAISANPSKVMDHIAIKESSPNHWAALYYGLTCMTGGNQVDPEVAKEFLAFSGEVDNRYTYHIVQYPTPAAADPTNMVLAPYFSAIVVNNASRAIEYLVLGQSPDGGTILRTVHGTTNANLGRSCPPALPNFLQLLRERAAKKQAMP